MTRVEHIAPIVKLSFKTTMLKSKLCNHSNAYIVVKRTLTVSNTGTAAAPNNRNREVVFKNCASFTNCISGINNTQIA